MATISKERTKRHGTKYRVQIRRRGRYVSKTFADKERAEDWAKETEGRFKELDSTGWFEAARHTLPEALERYSTEAEFDPDIKLSADKKRHIEYWCEKFGSLKLSDLNQQRIDSELTAMLANKKTKRTPGTVNRYRTSLGALMTACMRWGWIPSNPVHATRKKREPRGRERYLSESERDRLFKACKESSTPGLEVLVRLALSTGARSGELHSLTWDRVDLKKGTVLFTKTKTDRSRVVPVVGPALDLLKAWSKVRLIDSDLVFPSNVDPSNQPYNFRKAWEAALSGAEIEGFRFHDLRHSTGTELTRLGVPTHTIAKILGHSSLSVTQRYAHVNVDVQREALERAFK